ncbi:unnamed protein product [Trichobilharzia szidati]|nr:unnamed protein product [Trichobilharzia szidati]
MCRWLVLWGVFIVKNDFVKSRTCFLSTTAGLFITLFAFSFTVQVYGEQCNREIVLKAQLGKQSYARWVNTSTTLLCPGDEFTSIIWYSSRKIYRMAVGCLRDEYEFLRLDWFPDVPEIVAIYVSYEKRIRQTCLFSSSNGILSTNLFLESLGDHPNSPELSATIYIKDNSAMTNIFFICKQGEVRNGTCRSHTINGTFFNGEETIHKNDMFYKIINEFVPVPMGKHECFARINGTYYVVSVTFSSKDDWSPHGLSSYSYMKEQICGSDICIHAANQGRLLCDAGIHDCYETDNTYQCENGVPLIDSCEYLAKDSDWTCPHVSENSSKIFDFGRSLYSISYNAQTLYRINPDYILNLTSKLTNDELKLQLASNSISDRHSIVSHLLDSMRFALDETPTFVERTTVHSPRNTSEFLSGASTKKLQTASVFLHIISEIARQTPTVVDMLASGKENRENLQFWHLSPVKGEISLNNSQGSALEMFVKSNQSEVQDTFIAVIPTARLPGIQLTELLSVDKDKEESMVGSDILLVDTSTGVSFTVSVNLSEKPNISASCEQLQQGPNFKEIWNNGNCKTVIVGYHYECQCFSNQDGTFAIALIYWLGTSDIPSAHVYSISIVNYVFTLVTIVALFLFLIFTRFIGVFRLDQFNIAFCLMISAIVSLTIPHITDRQHIMCTVVAVAVCYFPLAAFAWKFIFGLNTLILIISPHSRLHDLVSKPKYCLPLIWVAYLSPAVIIGVWFGYTGEVSNSGLCIGPKTFRWSFVGPITAIVSFNFLILFIVGFVLLKNYFLTRKSKLNKTTHLLVLLQLMLTLGIPYIAIYIQLLDAFSMLIVVPIAMALTAVLMFILVAVVDEENRLLLRSFILTHIARQNEYSSRTIASRSKCDILSNSKGHMPKSLKRKNLCSNLLEVQTSDNAENRFQCNTTSDGKTSPSVLQDAVQPLNL